MHISEDLQRSDNDPDQPRVAQHHTPQTNQTSHHLSITSFKLQIIITMRYTLKIKLIKWKKTIFFEISILNIENLISIN